MTLGVASIADDPGSSKKLEVTRPMLKIFEPANRLPSDEERGGPRAAGSLEQERGRGGAPILCWLLGKFEKKGGAGSNLSPRTSTEQVTLELYGRRRTGATKKAREYPFLVRARGKKRRMGIFCTGRNCYELTSRRGTTGECARVGY